MTSALCGLAPTLEWLVLFRLLQGAAGALLVPGSLSIITQTFEGGAERGRAFGIWASATSGLVLLGPLVGGLLVDTVGWRFAFLINVPVLAFALWVTLRHVAESRDTGRAALRLAGLGRRRHRRRRPVLRPDPRRGARVAGPGSPGSAIAIGVVALLAFPILMARRTDPARAAVAVPLASVHHDQPRDVLHLRRPVRRRSATRASCFQNVLGYTALGAGAVGLPTGLCLTLLSTPRRRAPPAGSGRGRSWSAGPLLMAAACSGCRACRSTRDPWLPRVTDPVDADPADATSSSTSCRRSSCSGSASRASSRR